ncbi:MAG: redoxin domain-containing protein [Anaerolineae bacterium]|nr:redoxin domain-containing protein [Anaerolineae bacterium]
MESSPDAPLEPGALAPDFELETATGKRISREDFRGKAGLVLVFFRWDPAIRPYLDAIAHDMDEYTLIGSRVLAITDVGREALRAALAWQLPFPLAADPDGRAWQAYTRRTEYAYAVFVLDMYGGVDSQKVAATLDELPAPKMALDWSRAAQYRCNI